MYLTSLHFNFIKLAKTVSGILIPVCFFYKTIVIERKEGKKKITSSFLRFQHAL